MKTHAKLGRLVVSGAGLERRWSTGAVFGVVAITLMLAIALCAFAWYVLGTPPRKLVFRGSSLLGAPELAAIMDINGSESALSVWRKCRAFTGEGTRWTKSARCRLLPGRTMLIEIAEKKPLLRVVAGKTKLWLCQDGWLKQMDVEQDHGEVFDVIRQLPTLQLAAAEPDTRLVEAEGILEAAAACYAALPGEISLIELTGSGEIVLYDKGGFPIRLGQPTKLSAKISALPKALRICNENRDKLLYLDASNPTVFYEKWKEPQVEAGI